MSEIDRLLSRYQEQISIPWNAIRSDAERTLFVIYGRTKERQLRYRFDEFRQATEAIGKRWKVLDLTDAFPKWFAAHEYRDEYFEHPDDVLGYNEGRIPDFEKDMIALLTEQIAADATAEHAIAILGVGALLGVAKVSALMKRIAASVPGRLVIFFPGEKVDNNYRLLGARDGWDYLATAITAE